MNNILDKYKNVIDKDKALYIDIIEAYTTNQTEILEETNTTLILLYKVFPLYLVLTSDYKEALNLLSKYDVTYMVTRNKEISDFYMNTNKYDQTVCHQVYYDGPILNLKDELDIRIPDEKDLKVMGDTYNLGGYYAIKDAYDRKALFSAYLNNDLVGYVGLHDDMSCGMLYIFEKYRNKGYGLELEKYIINYQLKRHHIPYGQVITNNQPSLNLQKKINLNISKGLIYWIWKE